MIDLAALITELETNPRYDATVVSGSNSGTLALLLEDEPGQTTFTTATANEVRQAVGNGIRTLTAAQIQQLRFLVSEGDEGVDFSVPAIRQELAQIFDSQQPVKDRLAALASRPRTFGEAFGGQPTLNDVRAAVRQISKSLISQHANDPPVGDPNEDRTGNP